MNVRPTRYPIRIRLPPAGGPGNWRIRRVGPRLNAAEGLPVKAKHRLDYALHLAPGDFHVFGNDSRSKLWTFTITDDGRMIPDLSKPLD